MFLICSIILDTYRNVTRKREPTATKPLAVSENRTCPHHPHPPSWPPGSKRRRAVTRAPSARGCPAGRRRFAALPSAAFTAPAAGLRTAIATPGSTAYEAVLGRARQRACARSSAGRAGSLPPLKRGYMGLFAQIAPGTPIPPPLRGGRNFGSRRLEKFRVGGQNHEGSSPPNLLALRARTFDRPAVGAVSFIVYWLVARSRFSRHIVHLLVARSRFSRHRTIML
jgi:hypothetical protein